MEANVYRTEEYQLLLEQFDDLKIQHADLQKVANQLLAKDQQRADGYNQLSKSVQQLLAERKQLEQKVRNLEDENDQLKNQPLQKVFVKDSRQRDLETQLQLMTKEYDSLQEKYDQMKDLASSK